jgi:hypothetical protein
MGFHTVQPSDKVKISIRVADSKRQEIKAVAALSGTDVQGWLEAAADRELERMRPALQALRMASAQ